MTTDNRPVRATRPTPGIDALLARLRARVTRQVWLHGLGSVAVVAALCLLCAFALDWWLHLPVAVRWIELATVIGLPTFVLWRELVRPLARRPDRTGLAVLVERAHPSLDELFVSAVQLAHDPDPSGEPELVAAVIDSAEARARTISLDPVLAPRGPRRRALGGAVAAALVLFVMAANADSAGVFFARLFGADVHWPQRTHLAIEIPSSSLPANSTLASATTANGAPAEAPDIERKVARGSDVQIIVRAEGEVPDEVTLHFQDGHKAVLAAGGGPEFRTVLRSVQSDVEFYATGGDDQDEHPRALLHVLQPPDVAGLCVEIHPPAYSGLPARTEFERDVEVLVGTDVVVHVLTDPLTATGHARLLPEDRVVELSKQPFPPTPGETESGAAPRDGLGFALHPEKSLRYRFELTDSTGLSNPDPGLFGITVIEDRAPEVEILSPGRGDFDTVVGGLMPLRVRAEDDFGVAHVSYTLEAAIPGEGAQHPGPVELSIVPVAVEARTSANEPGRPARQSTARSAVLARTRLEIAKLGGTEPVSEGRQFTLQAIATDIAEPKPHEGHASPLRIRVVSNDEFMRRIQDRLSRAQTSASALGELVREKNRRTGELLSALESDGPEGATAELAAALTGQRRVQGDARALSRELTSCAESVLYARLDDRALAALDMIDEKLAQQSSRVFDPTPWRELAAASRDRAIAGSGLSGKLVDISGMALEISEDLAQQATDEMVHAGEAIDLAKVHDRLQAASVAQKAMLARIDALLERLAEWDNFQSVLMQTRDILNGQKSVSERSRQAATSPK